MPSQKQLNGIAHNLGHHAQSSLSYLWPSLDEACRLAGRSEATIDLLAPEPYPAGLPRLRPLELALAALRDWFSQLLDREGFVDADVTSAVLSIELQFEPGMPHAVDRRIRSTVTGSRGRTFAQEIPFIRQPRRLSPLEEAQRAIRAGSHSACRWPEA
jgi:hypothetical protein